MAEFPHMAELPHIAELPHMAEFPHMAELPQHGALPVVTEFPHMAEFGRKASPPQTVAAAHVVLGVGRRAFPIRLSPRCLHVGNKIYVPAGNVISRGRRLRYTLSFVLV